MAFGSAAQYLMRQGLRIPPMDDRAATPATYARSVFTKRQEAFSHRRKAVDRFTSTTTKPISADSRLPENPTDPFSSAMPWHDTFAPAIQTP